MTASSIHFGKTMQWRLPPESEGSWLRLGPQTPEPLEDPAAAIAAALDAPLDFPPLRQAVIPGDRIAVAVGPDLPQREPLLAGLVRSLVEGQVSPQDITVVYPAGETPVDASKWLAQAPIRQVVHDPTRREGLSYLAATAAARPIYFPRPLIDADVVIPLGCRGPSGHPRGSMASSALFPNFSDRDTQQRLEQLIQAGDASGAFEQELEEATWLLGVQLAVDVVRGAGGTVVRIVAGTPAQVRAVSQSTSATIWQADLDQQPAVVGSVRPENRASTWVDVARALESAIRVVDPDGAIVLLTDLAIPPTEPLRSPAGEPAGAIRHQAPPITGGEAMCAALLRDMPEHFRVYLSSDLPGSAIEEAGWIPLASEPELHRLMAQFAGGVIVDEMDRMVLAPRSPTPHPEQTP